MTQEQIEYNCEHEIIDLGDDESPCYACVLCGYTEGATSIAQYLFGSGEPL